LTLYLDSSSLVKLYVDESGCDVVRALRDAAILVTTSDVAYPEIRAALARRRREGSLTSGEFGRARTDFEQDWSRLGTIPATTAICHEAGELAERYHLRGFDSLHLASFADMLRGLQGTDDVKFSSFDDRLNAAARRLARTLK
jgi:uncharacterized protein